MARPPQPSTSPEDPTYVQIRLPGWLKNQIIEHCESLDCTLNAWLVETVIAAIRQEQGLPQPPPARAPLPTVADQIRAWALGERMVMPCGKTESCAAFDGDTWHHDGMGFCNSCGIRVA